MRPEIVRWICFRCGPSWAKHRFRRRRNIRYVAASLAVAVVLVVGNFIFLPYDMSPTTRSLLLFTQTLIIVCSWFTPSWHSIVLFSPIIILVAVGVDLFITVSSLTEPSISRSSDSSSGSNVITGQVHWATSDGTNDRGLVLSVTSLSLNQRGGGSTRVYGSCVVSVTVSSAQPRPSFADFTEQIPGRAFAFPKAICSGAKSEVSQPLFEVALQMDDFPNQFITPFDTLHASGRLSLQQEREVGGEGYLSYPDYVIDSFQVSTDLPGWLVQTQRSNVTPYKKSFTSEPLYWDGLSLWGERPPMMKLLAVIFMAALLLIVALIPFIPDFGSASQVAVAASIALWTVRTIIVPTVDSSITAVDWLVLTGEICIVLGIAVNLFRFRRTVAPWR